MALAERHNCTFVERAKSIEAISRITTNPTGQTVWPQARKNINPDDSFSEIQAEDVEKTVEKREAVAAAKKEAAALKKRLIKQRRKYKPLCQNVSAYYDRQCPV